MNATAKTARGLSHSVGVSSSVASLHWIQALEHIATSVDVAELPIRRVDGDFDGRFRNVFDVLIKPSLLSVELLSLRETSVPATGDSLWWMAYIHLAFSSKLHKITSYHSAV